VFPDAKLSVGYQLELQVAKAEEMVEVAQVGERFDESMRFLQNPWMSFPFTLLPLTAHDIFFLLFCER